MVFAWTKGTLSTCDDELFSTKVTPKDHWRQLWIPQGLIEWIIFKLIASRVLQFITAAAI